MRWFDTSLICLVLAGESITSGLFCLLGPSLRSTKIDRLHHESEFLLSVGPFFLPICPNSRPLSILPAPFCLPLPLPIPISLPASSSASSLLLPCFPLLWPVWPLSLARLFPFLISQLGGAGAALSSSTMPAFHPEIKLPNEMQRHIPYQGAETYFCSAAR